MITTKVVITNWSTEMKSWSKHSSCKNIAPQNFKRLLHLHIMHMYKFIIGCVCCSNNVTTISFHTANYCLKITENHDTYSIIEIQSYVHINTLVGVESTAKGSNLSLQVRLMYKMSCTIRINSINTLSRVILTIH